MNPLQYYWRLIRYQPKYYASDIITISIHFAFTTALGRILRAFFNYLTGESSFALPLWPIVGLQIAYALIVSRWLVVYQLSIHLVRSADSQHAGTGAAIARLPPLAA